MKFNTLCLALLLALPLGLTGCADDGVVDKLEEAGHDAKRGIEDAVD